MPLVTPLPVPGGLGFLLPPMPPLGSAAASSRTTGTTQSPTFGSTRWVTDLSSGAELAGASGVWASDHLFWTTPAPECLTTLAVAASVTRTAAIGACVLQLALRAPGAVAKQAAALQTLSGGRFVLGVGVGSHEPEYELAGVSFGSRGRTLDAGISALRAAWDSTGRDGYRLEPAPPVPVWVGGSSPAALRRAAAVGDGWVPLFIAPERFAESVGLLRELSVEAGRDAGAVVPSVVMVASVGDDAAVARASGTAWLSALYGLPAKAFERRLVAGPAEHCADVAARYMAAGAEHVIVMVAADDALGEFRALAAAHRGLGDPEGRSRARRFDLAEVGA